jgi:sporulation protein YlmC with PRC-barrel domain
VTDAVNRSTLSDWSGGEGVPGNSLHTFDELQVVEQDGDIRLVYAATREQLEAAPEFDRTAYDPSARFAEEQAAMAPATDATGGGMAPAPSGDMAATDTTTTEEPAAAPEPTTAEADATAPAGDAAAPAEQDMAAAPEADTTSGDAPTPEQDMAATSEAPADTAAPDATAGEDLAAAPATEGEGFLSFSPDQIRASTLIGKEVFSAEDESIGEVSDLVLQEDGATRVAIIDVGGFLGVGEKPVAIPFEQIEVQQQEGGDARLTTAMTREELEQAPAFEDSTTGDVAATDQTAPAEGTAEPAPGEDVAADTTQPAEGDVIAGAEAEGAGFETATQDLSAEELLGSAVQGTNDENIGEVGDVIFAETGDIEAVVIDVGGFLGVGEKPVAVQFDALNVQKDTNGEVQLKVNASQEQLENAPSYQEEQAAVQ